MAEWSPAAEPEGDPPPGFWSYLLLSLLIGGGIIAGLVTAGATRASLLLAIALGAPAWLALKIGKRRVDAVMRGRALRPLHLSLRPLPLLTGLAICALVAMFWYGVGAAGGWLFRLMIA